MLFSSAPQASSGGGRERQGQAPRDVAARASAASGRAARARSPPLSERTTESSDAHVDRAIVHEQRVRERAQAARARRRPRTRSARRSRCRWSSRAPCPRPRAAGDEAESMAASRRGRASRARPLRPTRAPRAAAGDHDRALAARASCARRSRAHQLAKRRPRRAAISANGFSSRRLRRRSSVTARSLVRAARQVVAAGALDRDDPARHQRRRGHRAAGSSAGDRLAGSIDQQRAATGRTRGTRSAGRESGGSPGPRTRRRTPRTSAKAAIVVRAPVVGDAAHDREARAAVRAVDERVAVAAIVRVAQLLQALARTGRRPARHERRGRAEPRRPPACREGARSDDPKAALAGRWQRLGCARCSTSPAAARARPAPPGSPPAAFLALNLQQHAAARRFAPIRPARARRRAGGRTDGSRRPARRHPRSRARECASVHAGADSASRRCLPCHAGSASRRRASGQSANASTPSPVRALTSMWATPGWTRSRFCEEALEREVEVGQEVDLVDHHELARAEHQRVLQRLVLALRHRGDHRAGVLTDAELRRAHEVADVLDHEQVDLLERQRRAAPSGPCSRPGGTRRRSPGRC